MGVPEPSKEPEWASVLANDPVSGQPNRAEPSESKKDSGFDFKERPPRQDFNWILWLIWQWVLHFKSRIQGLYNNLEKVISDTGITPDVEDTASQLQSGILRMEDDNFLSGFHIVDWPANNEIEISKGRCRSDDGSIIIDALNFDYGSPMTKTFESGSYATGSGNNGKADGVTITGRTFYHLFVFLWDDSGTKKVDLCFDDNTAGSNLPTNLGKRRIMTLKYDGGLDFFPEFVPTIQYGDDFIYASRQYMDQQTYDSGTPRSMLDLSWGCPSDIDVDLHVQSLGSATGMSGAEVVMFRTPSEHTHRQNANAGVLWQFLPLDWHQVYMRRYITGNNRQLYCGFPENAAVSPRTINVNLYAMGYTDLRGKDWGSGPAINRYFDQPAGP